MASYIFQVYKNFEKSNNPYNWENGCDSCKGKFAEDEKFIRVDVASRGFGRGDDDVYVYHKKCWMGEEAFKKDKKIN